MWSQCVHNRDLYYCTSGKVITHCRSAQARIKLLLCEHQTQIHVRHVILQNVLDLGGIQVWIVTLKILQEAVY